MLHTLRIRNYALIDDIEVEFAAGFNAMTGETGAGKSIVVGALNLVLGGRASSEAVRKGAKSAKIDAVFTLPHPSKRLTDILTEHELELEDDELLVSRVVSAEGRSKAYACGSLIPVAVLSAIGDELVDLHGQHEHQSLLRGDRQLGLLDAYAGIEDEVDRLAHDVRALRELEQTITALEDDDRERTRRFEFMRFELEEIDKAGLEPGEDEDLKGRRNLIANAEKIYRVAADTVSALSEGEEPRPVMDVLGTVARDLEELGEVDERFRELIQRMDAAQTELEGIANDIRALSESIDFDPAELDTINTRLSLIRDLKKKYGASIDDILAYGDRIRGELADFDNRDERLAQLRAEAEQHRAAVMEQARALSKRRADAAKTLERDVSAGLQDLGMKGARFSVSIKPVELTAHGIDQVLFLLAANAGEDAKPLKTVASGGEISRIMLALKAVFAQADAIPTLIFDEIDTGVGGAVATQVAAKMRALAATHQTIVITHLAQIAAAANRHFNVAKASTSGVTTTKVTRIDEAARVEEIARLLDGTVTELSLKHAESLLGGSGAEQPKIKKKRGTA